MNHLQWLEDNAGKYEIRVDNSTWTFEDGTSIINKFSISFKGTQMSFTQSLGLKGAIEEFSRLENEGYL